MIWPVVLFRISGQIQNTTFPGKGGSFIPHPLQISVPSIPLSRCLLNLYTYPDLSRSTTPPNFRNIGTNADVMKRFSENKICFPFPFENKTNDEKVWNFFEIFTKQRRLWRSNCISPRSPTFLRPFRICCHIWNPTFPGGGTTDYSQKKLTFGYVTCRRSWPYTLHHICTPSLGASLVQISEQSVENQKVINFWGYMFWNIFQRTKCVLHFY